MRKSRFLFNVIIFFVFTAKISAQDFNYTTANTTANYSALVNPASIVSGENWSDTVFSLPIGFNFQLCGTVFDSISICRNGFINFGKDRRVTLLTFLGFGYAGNLSAISTELSGTNGSHIRKLEFKNCDFPGDTLNGRLSYQVWLYENNGDITIHVGQNDFSGLQDSAVTAIVGLINPHMDLIGATNSYLLFGNPNNLQTQVMSEGDEIMRIIRIPAEGKVWTLSKSN